MKVSAFPVLILPSSGGNADHNLDLSLGSLASKSNNFKSVDGERFSGSNQQPQVAMELDFRMGGQPIKSRV